MRTMPISGAFVDQRQRTFAYAMALVLLVLLGGGYTLISWKGAVSRYEIELETQAVLGAQAVDTYFVMVEKSFAELGRRLKVEGLGPGTGAILAEHKQRFPEFEIVVANTLEGEVFATSEPPRPGPNANLGREPGFMLAKEALLRGEGMVVSRAFKGPVSKRWNAPLRYGVRDVQGNLQFLLGGGLSLERTHEFWKDAPLRPGAGMGILRDDTYVIARYPKAGNLSNDVLFGNPAPGVLGEYIRAHGPLPSGVIRGRSALTGEQTIVCFRRLRHYPLTFFVTKPEADLRAMWWSAAWPTYALMLALFAGGVAIVGWIGRRQVQWQAEREVRMAMLEAQAAKEHAINAELDALSRRQLASNTELTALTASLSLSNDRLQQANAELEAFMYSVSHDLKGPIRAIDGFAAILQDSLALPPEGQDNQLFQRIRSASRRMADLLNDMLELSRYSSKDLEKESIDMRAKVDSVIAELGPDTAKARFEIGELPPCLGDRVLLRQVWINLIANALKFSAHRAQPVIRIGFHDGAYFVADNGAGFDMAYADKLFQLFSRLHYEREFEGTGIGLAIVKRVVERLGGQVGAEGEIDKGARFWFALPA